MQVGDERIRVVFLISHLLDSGIERQAFTQAKHMDRSEFAVTLITARTSRRETGQLSRPVRESGLRLVRVRVCRAAGRCGRSPMSSTSSPQSIMLLRERPHVIYTHGLMVQHRRALAWLAPSPSGGWCTRNGTQWASAALMSGGAPQASRAKRTSSSRYRFTSGGCWRRSRGIFRLAGGVAQRIRSRVRSG